MIFTSPHDSAFSSASGLVQNQARLLALLEHVSTGVLVADANGLVRLVNKAFRSILGSWSGRPGDPLRQCAPLLMGGLSRDLGDLVERGREFDREWLLPGSGGGRRSRLQGRLVRDAAGRTTEMLLLLDPPRVERLGDTERARLERLLRRSQRLESFALLSAGIVHDLNNVLACVLGATELLQATLEEGSPGGPLAAQISQATQRGAQMTRKVLSLARLEEGPRGPVNVNLVAHDVMVLLRRSVDPRIDIHMNLNPADLCVQAETTTLHQVLMNLCVNSRDAMPEGGELHVSTGWAVARDLRDNSTLPGESRLAMGGDALLELDPDTPLVRLEVRDTGTGIEPQLLGKIFDPFFTTKEGGRGTGLGLAMVLKSVEELGGRLELRTKRDWGTTMRLFFPWYDQALPKSPLVASGSPREMVTGRGRIMVVDDDEVVRTTMCDLIRTLGYEVQAMPDGLAAVEAFQDSPDAWDLILLDLMMPRMDGVEALRRIRALRDGQPVLVVTGFAGPQNVQKLEQIARVPMLMKPIQIRELSRHIAELVN